VSRIVSGGWRLTLAPVALAPVVRGAVEALKPSVDSKGIALDLALPAETLTVRGDAERLQQVAGTSSRTC
jgi:signal transduction histidine kinase